MLSDVFLNIAKVLCFLYLAWHAVFVAMCVCGCVASIVGSIYNSIATARRGGL